MFAMKWMFSPKFVAGAAVGYLFGARAGREQYDKIMSKVNVRKDQMTAQARETGAAVLDKVKDKTPFGSDGAQDPAGRHAGRTAGLGGEADSSAPRGAADSAAANAKVMHASGRG